VFEMPIPSNDPVGFTDPSGFYSNYAGIDEVVVIGHMWRGEAIVQTVIYEPGTFMQATGGPDLSRVSDPIEDANVKHAVGTAVLGVAGKSIDFAKASAASIEKSNKALLASLLKSRRDALTRGGKGSTKAAQALSKLIAAVERSMRQQPGRQIFSEKARILGKAFVAGSFILAASEAVQGEAGYSKVALMGLGVVLTVSVPPVGLAFDAAIFTADMAGGLNSATLGVDQWARQATRF